MRAREETPMVDMETCSWCTAEVPYSTLRESKAKDGAMLCRDCKAEEK